MATLSYFEELAIWQQARQYNREIFKISNSEDFGKDYRMKSQIRAAAGSIMDNIAEGFEREGNKEFIQFLYIAKGSCGETRSQLYRALDYGYMDENIFNTLKEDSFSLSKSIANFIQYLKNSEHKGHKFT
jgi:four helix bundle protein